MTSRLFTARDAAKKFGALLDAADDNPVIIHRHGRPRAAVIGWRLFELYRKAYDDAFDARQVRLLELQLEAVVAGKLGTSGKITAFARRLAAGEADVGDRAPGEKAPER